MKQVLQHPRTGEIEVSEVPLPQLLPGCVLVRVAASLVSAGTERAATEFASKNLLQKARSRPDLVRDVFEKVRRDGVLSAVRAVRSRLDQPTALGYSSSGTVIGVGEGITDLSVGDRVSCAGAGFAVHAEVACVPRLLVARIPNDASVSFDEAAFATVGAVALHGIRTAEVKLGDVVAVIGLGLLGQLTVQMLKAAGCRVVGLDIVPERAELALKLGVSATCTSSSAFQDICLEQTNGVGADAVLITAETASSEPVNLAGRVARDRAIVVAVGTVGIEIERKAYYEKELDFRISRSYGPGRYDAAYEQGGRDYPIGHVRWTENRNMQAFLRLLADQKLDIQSLITHRYPIEQVRDAYDLITGKRGESFLGVLFTYPEHAAQQDQYFEVSARSRAAEHSAALTIGLLGAGSFATGTLLPEMRKVRGVELVGACAATGAHSRHAADKFGFRYCTTDQNQILQDAAINTVVITTRHHLHAAQVLAALGVGKNVFCEKPLCLREEELANIVRTFSGLQGERPGQVLMVGFNRRFSPMAIRMKSFLANVHEPLVMHYRVNAGSIARDHWVNDPEQGGGRILGEICHFVDFLSFLAGAQPVEVHARGVADDGRYSGDNVVASLEFANGSQGTITYVASGDRAFSKERVEVFGGGLVAALDDFRSLELVKHGRLQATRSRLRQDKGHRAEWEAMVGCIRDGKPIPIPFEEIVSTTLATMKIAESLSVGHAVPVNTSAFVSEALGFRPADE
jgi:predicted dehydrogenase